MIDRSGIDRSGIDRSDVEAARARIGDRLRLTPVLDAVVDTVHGPVPVSFKLEYLQFGGSFKTRGSLNALLHSAVDASGVVIASGGNAGIAAATAAAMQGVGCAVVVPENAPAAKVAALHTLGADVVQHGTSYAEAFECATALAIERGSVQLHAYDLPDIVAGAGTIGLELDEQVPEANPVLVAVGGGGLIAGIATGVSSDRSVIGVEPQGIPTLHSALRNGSPVDVAVDSIAADSLGAKRIGDIAMSVAAAHGITSILVTDDAIVAARDYLWRHFRIAVEFGGATALAALLSGAYVPEEGERPVVVLCGANTDPATL